MSLLKKLLKKALFFVQRSLEKELQGGRAPRCAVISHGTLPPQEFGAAALLGNGCA